MKRIGLCHRRDQSRDDNHHKNCSKDVQDRYSNAQDVINDLRTLQNQEGNDAQALIQQLLIQERKTQNWKMISLLANSTHQPIKLLTRMNSTSIEQLIGEQ